MITYYPSHTHIKNNYRRIAGQHGGITESQVLFCNTQALAPKLSICANEMPSYEKILISEKAKISYHLSGYGMFREESLVKLYGESVERYALLVAAQMWTDKVVYHTYNEMQQMYDMLPWEYVKVFSDADYDMLAKKTNIRNITPDDVIGWLECPSLLEVGKKIFIPIQCLFIGYHIREDLGERMFVPSFSKGSAAHTNLYKALQSAILEAIEADAFMIKWYTQSIGKKVRLDDLNLMDIIDKMLGKTNYELTLYDFTTDSIPGYVFAAGLINKNNKAPFALMGCSASLNPSRAAYRATAEAATIHYLAANGPMMSPLDFLNCQKDDFLNLDSNVSFWTKAENQEMKKKLLRGRYDGVTNMSNYLSQEKDSDEENLKYLISGLKGISKYAVYLDITPVEVLNMGIKVMRVFIPELVQLSFPGVPYSNHPRILEHGGIVNEFPHPMP